MSRVNWTKEETALLIIFAMWGIRHEAIAEILTNRRAEIRAILTVPPYTRTVSAVRNKLTEVRSQNPRLWDREQGWDRDAVVEFLYQSTLDHAQVTRLLSWTAADIEIIIQVCIHYYGE